MNKYSIKQSNILKTSKLATLIIFFISLYSCDMIKMKQGLIEDEETKSDPIARVHDIYLYPEDLEGLVSSELSPEDSASRMKQVVNSWVKKQLVISEANSRLTLDEAELERRLLDYKYALMIHEFEEQYVNSELNYEVTSEEINQYYENNIDNFRLNQNIVKGIFVQLPKKAPEIRRFRNLISSRNIEKYNELVSYCHSYATKAHLGDSSWVYFEQMIVNTPFHEIDDKKGFLERNKFVEREDENYIYFLNILEYRLVNEISPIEFVWDEVEKIILNKRKVKLVSKLENEIFESAEKNDDFEIYTEN